MIPQPIGPSSSRAERRGRFNAIAYSIFLLLLTITAAGIIFNGSKYVLKDQLHLSPNRLSMLTFLFDAAWFLSFLLGFYRDRWRPFGPHDRRLLVLCPLLAAAFTVTSGLLTPRLVPFCALLTLANASSVAANVVLTGQLAAVTKRFGITGRVGALMNLVPFLTNALLGALTGILIERWNWTVVCYASAAISLTAMAAAVWQPRALIQSIYAARPELAPEHTREPLRASLRRLCSSRAVFIAATINALWCFSPGWGTPLFYHFTDHLHLTDSQFEFTQSAERLVNAVASLAYLLLCLRFSSKSLLYFGISLGVLSAVGFAFTHDYRSAILSCAWYGVTSGIGNSACNDMLLRITPRHLEAVAAMFLTATSQLVIDCSDLTGSLLYEHGGFLTALAVACTFNLLLIPLLAFLPTQTFAQREGTPIDDRPPTPAVT